MTHLVIDATDFARIAAVYAKLPKDMQAIAFRRAAARARGAVERDYARFASRTLKVAQKLVRARMRSFITSKAEIELVVRSTNIPLNEMNPSQRGYGVFVPGRGRYERAFIAASKSKRAAGLVLMRKGKSRLPTQMLFGPNPANAIDRKPGDYEDILSEIAQGEFAKTILQQVEFLLGRAG